MSDWFNWTNLWYLMGIMVAGGATFVGMKYKKMIAEMKDVFKALQEAYADDGKLDNEERKKIMKEVLDVMGALLKIAWK
jgi:phage tail tape-measure protein|tara:strand:+ start:1974 stop:2210 length:237 start_codon:yes stop_codon:yes gene_type:complete